jgi:hypothetical protein
MSYRSPRTELLTHEVLNQARPLEDVNLFTADEVLMSVCGRPAGCKRVFREALVRRYRCFRVSGLLMRLFTWPLACMEIADRAHTALARSRRLDISLVFPTPSSDRCAIPLV